LIDLINQQKCTVMMAFLGMHS